MARAQISAVMALVLSSVGAPSFGAGMTFEQVDWLANGGGYTLARSDWGIASLQLSGADVGLFHPTAELGGGVKGFVNIVTTVPGGGTENWAVQNKPLFFKDAAQMEGRLPDSIMFDLGTARGVARVTALDYRVVITADPVATAPAGVMVPAAVSVTERLWGGLDEPAGDPTLWGNTGVSAPGGAVNYRGAGPGEVFESSGKIPIKESDIPVVSEDPNMCGPGSTARSLKYLSNSGAGGLYIPQAAQQIYDGISGNLTGPKTADNIIAAKQKYLDDKNIKGVDTKKQGSAKAAIAALMAGGDVEAVAVGGSNAGGGATGGHVAMVTEINLIRDPATGRITKFEIKVVDDPNQSDGLPENKTQLWNIDPATLEITNSGDKSKGDTLRKFGGFIVETVPEPVTLPLLLLAVPMLARRR